MPTDNLLLVVVGGLVFGGVVITRIFLQMPAKNFFIGIPGVIIGLIISSLLAVPLQKLPGDFGLWVPITVTVVTVVASVYIFYDRRDFIEKHLSDAVRAILPAKRKISDKSLILLDTSAIIDGRFMGILESGFLMGKILLYRFVLEELQKIADSGDDLKREKGRRALELLEMIEEKKNAEIEIVDEDVKETKEVDAMLLKVAKERGAAIMTVDYNLNKIAKIQGVKVLNINELSEAIKPAIIPGEEMKIKIVQSGKEKHQGVGYLPDGTMIVVEKGERYVGKEREVTVSRIIQTPAGKMYFAKIRESGGNH